MNVFGNVFPGALNEETESDAQVFSEGASSALFSAFNTRSVTHSFGCFFFPKSIQVLPEQLQFNYEEEAN